MNTKIREIIQQGLDFLLNAQEEDGSFVSYSAADKNDFGHSRTYHSTFPSSLILSCLCNLDETPQTKNVKDKIAGFLLSQKSEHWSFNYWTRGSGESKTLPYPDDLDDTFCALSALMEHDAELIDGPAMARIVTLLTAVEQEEGGPYRTWLVSETAEEVWKDVDLAVNSNVAYFLSLHDVSLPKIDSLIESAIDADQYVSPYYPAEYPIIYFISRFYRGDKVERIIDLLVSKRDRAYKWDNPLNTALAVSSLHNFGFSPDKLGESISYLMTDQQHGSWKPYAFCIDPSMEGKKYYAGSQALTTAFCLEALATFLQASESKTETRAESAESEVITSNLAAANEIYEEVVVKASKRFNSLPIDLREQALVFQEKFLAKDRDRQIVLMPLFFAGCLHHEAGRVPLDLPARLCLANLYGWIAYTIYDDFLDEEGNPELLSVANTCLRELTTILNSILPEETGFPSFFQQTMDALDGANTWEATHTRVGFKLLSIPDYGDYSIIADRSMGHALGPAAILFYLGYNPASPEFKSLMQFFKHFLIARQINDDAHDWEEDLKRGHINSVGALLLKRWKGAVSPVQWSMNDFQNNHFALQQMFWHDLLIEVCQLVLNHAGLARESLRELSFFADFSSFEKLLTPTENSAKKALKEQNDAVKFLETYEGEAPQPLS